MRRTFTMIGAVIAALTPAPAAAGRPLGRVISEGQGPWVAFVLLFGGLSVAILLIAVFGGGVGPRPVIGAPTPDPEAGREEPEPEAAPDAEADGADEGTEQDAGEDDG